MSFTPCPTLPRYLQVAHWLYDQQRAISARETADEFGVSSWFIERDFAKIWALPYVVVFDEEQVLGQDGRQYRLWGLRVYPYWLDEHRCPHRHCAGCLDCNVPLMAGSWCQLVHIPADHEHRFRTNVNAHSGST